MSHIVIFAGGDPMQAHQIDSLGAADLVIAADSGAQLARSLGWSVDELIGDFDSIDPSTAAWTRETAAVVHPHSPDKDKTDLELALDLATKRGATTISVVGGHGGRLDHLAANLALLGADRWPATVTWFAGGDRVEVVRAQRVFLAEAGTTLTVLPAGAEATGVSIQGVRWPLANVILRRGSTLGVSNEATGGPVTVDVESGALTVIFPEMPLR